MRGRTGVLSIRPRLFSSNYSSVSGSIPRFGKRKSSTVTSKNFHDTSSLLLTNRRTLVTWGALAFFATLISSQFTNKMNKPTHLKVRTSDVESLSHAHARRPLLRQPSLLPPLHHLHQLHPSLRHHFRMLLNLHTHHLTAVLVAHMVTFHRSPARVVVR